MKYYMNIIKKLKHKNKLCWVGDSDDKKTIKFSYTSLQKLIQQNFMEGLSCLHLTQNFT